MVIVIRRLLLVCFAGVLAGLPANSAEVEAGRPAVSDRDEAVCRHYENRARFKMREGDVEFVTVLAEACRASAGSLGAERAEERRAARVFLDRLDEFRNTIIAMNVERVFGADAAPHAPPREGSGALRGIPQVSPVGEFLIAHRMGLIDALDAWIGSGADFSLAAKGN